MKRFLEAAAVAALAAITGLCIYVVNPAAQIHDAGSGGGVYMNMTGGTVDGTGTSPLTIKPNSLLGITGTVTNDAANAGSVGELLTGATTLASAVALTTVTPNAVACKTLTAGDWDVWGTALFSTTGSTNTYRVIGINPTSAVGAAGTYVAYNFPTTTLTTGASPIAATTPTVPLQLAAATQECIAVSSTFSAGTEAVYGVLNARRRR